MSDELVTFEIDWDKEVDEVIEAGPRIITDYGALQYFGGHKVTLFAKDAKITIPDLLINGQPFERKGMKPGGKNTVHIFAWHGLSFQDDKPFTRVVLFTDLTNIKATDKLDSYPVISLNDNQIKAKEAGKEVYISDWSNLQFAALRSLPAEARKRLVKKEKVYLKADQWNTGAPPTESKTLTNNDGTPRKFYDHYWFNFEVFGSEAEMLAARAAAKGGSTNGVVGINDLPFEWVEAGGDRSGLYADIKERYEKGQAFSVIVKKCDLTGKTVDGSEVDAKALVAAALDQPVEMLESWFNA